MRCGSKRSSPALCHLPWWRRVVLGSYSRTNMSVPQEAQNDQQSPPPDAVSAAVQALSATDDATVGATLAPRSSFAAISFLRRRDPKGRHQLTAISPTGMTKTQT